VLKATQIISQAGRVGTFTSSIPYCTSKTVLSREDPARLSTQPALIKRSLLSLRASASSVVLAFIKFTLARDSCAGCPRSGVQSAAVGLFEGTRW